MFSCSLTKIYIWAIGCFCSILEYVLHYQKFIQYLHHSLHHNHFLKNKVRALVITEVERIAMRTLLLYKFRKNCPRVSSNRKWLLIAIKKLHSESYVVNNILIYYFQKFENLHFVGFLNLSFQNTIIHKIFETISSFHVKQLIMEKV